MKKERKSKPSTVELPENPERMFGPIVKRLRVVDAAQAAEMLASGARCARTGEDGHHLEWDEEAINGSEG
tara:strand:+ start:2649 stop:2858 length:210 start_codon:yes stop_codon:yes gene_type:complete